MRVLSLCGMVAVIAGLASFASSHPITVDGDASDWIGTPGGTDVFVYSGGEGIWNDSKDDDNGDGGDAPNASDNPTAYTYPDTNVFKGTEADIEEFRVTGDESANRIYFLVRLDYEITWMPFVVICVDLDHISGAGQADAGGYSHVNLDPLNEWEYVIQVQNMGVTVWDSTWTNVTGGSENFWTPNPTDGLIELGIDVSGWSPSPWGRTVYFTVLAGLQDFGHMRDVYYSSSLWQGGGGLNGFSDPNVYDLCFVSASSQPNELNRYTDSSWTTLSPGTVGEVDMNQIVPVEFPTWGNIKVMYR